jgi:hypothetical protein
LRGHESNKQHINNITSMKMMWVCLEREGESSDNRQVCLPRWQRFASIRPLLPSALTDCCVHCVEKAKTMRSEDGEGEG